jgi:hypothetical protein
MSEKSCKVTVVGSEGMSYTANVTAATLFTAAAAGLAAIRKSGWADVPFQPRKITVVVNEVPVEHEVSFKELERWASRPGGRSPAEIVERNRVKALLGMPDERRA